MERHVRLAANRSAGHWPHPNSHHRLKLVLRQIYPRVTPFFNYGQQLTCFGGLGLFIARLFFRHGPSAAPATVVS